MQFSIGNGLSAMGGAISQTAGSMALEDQKAELERQRMLLSDQLASTRETNLEKMRQSGQMALEDKRAQTEKDMLPLRTSAQKDIIDWSSKAQINAHIAETKADTDAAITKLQKLSTPDMLAAQHAIAAATITPNMQLEVGEDGTAMAFNPISGKSQPVKGPDGDPVKFQNPSIAAAVVQQTNTLRDAGSNLDRNYQSEMQAARVMYKDDPDKQQSEVDRINSYYRPKIAQINSQLQQLTNALGAKTGMAPGNPAGAPPLSSFLGGGGVGSLPGGSPSIAKPSGLINAPLGQ